VNLVLLDDGEVDASGDATLSDARAAHLLNVLNVRPERSVRIGLIDGPYGTGTVTSTSERALTMRCVFDTERPTRPQVDLLLALPRPKVMRRLWAQLAALGVGRITLTNAERVERCYFDTHVLDAAEYRPLLIEGLQQARDTRLPLVSIHRQFKILVEDHLDTLFTCGVRVVADPSVSTPLDRVVQAGETPRVLVAIGPEGGWNPFERELLQAHGFNAVGMGPRTLRSDTACVALLTLAHRAIAMAPGVETNR
jgi:RsmE family RNA methyltransferase